MKIVHEKNGVKIGGYQVAYPDPARVGLFDFGATTASPLEGIKGLFPADAWITLGAFIGADSEGHRRNLATFDTSVLDAIHGAGLPKAIEDARRIMQNSDLRPEIKSKRAAEPMLESLVELDGRLVEPVKSQIAVMDRWRKIVDAAFTPERPEIGFEAVQEIRAQEIRRIVSESKDGALVAMLDGAGKAGRLEVFGALRTDPMGRRFAPSEIMALSERAALDAHGIGFIADDLDRAREMVEAAGHRASSAVRVALVAIPGLTGGFKPGRFNATDFEGMAAAAIAATV
jgi:hypothetical protein